jgi:hypothetical protein
MSNIRNSQRGFSYSATNASGEQRLSQDDQYQQSRGEQRGTGNYRGNNYRGGEYRGGEQRGGEYRGQQSNNYRGNNRNQGGNYYQERRSDQGNQGYQGYQGYQQNIRPQNNYQKPNLDAYDELYHKTRSLQNQITSLTAEKRKNEIEMNYITMRFCEEMTEQSPIAVELNALPVSGLPPHIHINDIGENYSIIAMNNYIINFMDKNKNISFRDIFDAVLDRVPTIRKYLINVTFGEDYLKPCLIFAGKDVLRQDLIIMFKKYGFSPFNRNEDDDGSNRRPQRPQRPQRYQEPQPMPSYIEPPVATLSEDSEEEPDVSSDEE